MGLLLPGGAFGQNYSISDVGSNGWSYSEAHGLSGSGAVVGEYEPTNYIYILGFLYQDGVFTDVGHLSGTPYAVAYGINDSNAVVGESATADNTHAFLYNNGTMTDLGTLAGNVTTYSSAHAINRAGEIVGESSISFLQASTIHAALWSGNTKTDLGALGGNYSSASALNNSGDIVGESDVVSQGVTNVHAFKYANHNMQDLGTLGGNYSSATGVNDSGLIVGEAETLIGGISYLHAFSYNGSMHDLGTLGGATSSASAVNTAGQVVGYATDAAEESHAFLYDGSRMIDLNTYVPSGSGWSNLVSADAINDAGQIAGSGYLNDGSFHAYLLSPALPLTVAITSPAPNTTFSAPATFVVSASVSDTAGTVTNVQFQVNGTVIGNATSSPYSATANNLGVGTYRLTALASDNTGLIASNSITITVTDAPPSVTITSPAPNAIFQAPATFTVDATAADSDGTVTNVQFSVNSTVIGNATSSPYIATANNLGAGTYTLRAVASDNAGLTGTNSITVTVTDAPPTVAITSPAPNASFQAPATFTVTATASDTDGSVTNVQFLVNGTVIGNAVSSPYNATASNLNAGAYTLSAIASDNAGLNATNSINISVTNSTVAAVTISNPSFGPNGFSFSFSTQSGHTYQGQFATGLSSTSSWLTFTNLSGSGATVTVTDSTPTNAQRVYRVIAQ